MSHLDLNDAEQIKTLVVGPMVSALRSEIETQLGPLVKAQIDHEARIAGLEGNQKKAMIGWGAASLAVSVLVTSIWEWIRSKVHWG